MTAATYPLGGIMHPYHVRSKERPLPWAIIETEARAFQLHPNLVAAIVWVESKGDPNAIRYEPTFRYRLTPFKFAKECNITEETENLLQSCSLGAMQVMGCVARELGHAGSLCLLFDPRIGIHFGCKKLSQLMRKFELPEEAISAYNAGSLLFDKYGNFRNQDYVDSVLSKMKELGNGKN